MSEDLAYEIQTGLGISFAQAGAILPRRGANPVNRSTLLKWATVGCRAADGSVVRLEAARFGARWVTTKSALTRFAARLSATPDTTAPAGPTRKRAVAAAAARLEAAGA